MSGTLPCRRWPRVPAAIALFLSMYAAQPHTASGATSDIDALLDRAAKHADLFMQQFSDVKCNERVQQVKFNKEQKPELTREMDYDFLLMLQSAGTDIYVEESRLALGAEKSSKLPLVVTNGFSTLLLIFHSAYQPSFEFSPLGEEALAGRTRVRVHFRHVRGRRSPSVLLLRGREFPLSLEGTAWLDPETGAVARMVVGLAEPMEDIGLVKLQSEVEYAQTTFTADKDVFWLPRMAVIDVETRRQRWRNVHRFTEYKRFSVSATSSVGQNP